MESKKQFFPALLGESYAARRPCRGTLLTILLLAVLIVLNVALGALPMHIASPDVTGSETFRLSGAAKDWLAHLDESVTLYLVSAGGEAFADADLYAFLQQFSRASEHVSVKVLDSKQNAAALAAYGAEGIADQSVIVASAKRHRIIPNTELYYYYYPYSDGSGSTFSYEEYHYMLEYWAAADPTGSYVSRFMSGITAYFDGGSRVVNAINLVIAKDTSVACLVTNGSGVLPDTALLRKLSNAGYEIRKTDAVAQLPSDCDVLMLYAPGNDISEADATRLSEFLANGGKLFLLSSLTKTPERLNGVLAAYGISFADPERPVCDGNPNSAVTNAGSYLFRAQIQSKNAATADYAESFVVYAAHAIAVREAEGVSVTPWLYTTQAGYLADEDDNKTESAEKAVYTVGVTAQKGEARIVWLSCAQSLNENVDAAYASGANTLLARYGLTWLTGTDVKPVEIAPTVVNTEVLSVSYNAFIIWSVVLVLLIPTGVIVGGATVRYIRKKR